MKLYGGVLLKVDNPAFLRERSYDLPVVGKSMVEWVSLAFTNCPFCVCLPEGADFVSAVKEGLDPDTFYTVVLYSDTPLIQKKTLAEGLRMIKKRGEPVLRLTRGWIFETAYLRSLTRVPDAERYYLSEEEDFLTCMDFHMLAMVTEVMRNRILAHHMEHGVHIIDPASVYIDGDAEIAGGVTIYPGNSLKGRTVIGRGATLYERNTIVDSVIADGAAVTESIVERSFVGERVTVGPRAYIRPDCIVEPDCKVGDGVELKNTKLGRGTKVPHLTYLGDCETGEQCNIGGGVITANYDGEKKHRTVLGDRVFVGSNSTLIAPIRLESDSFVAAGSTLTDSVDAHTLAIARARQVNKERTPR